MSIFIDILKEVLFQIPNLFLHPMLYVGIIILILLYRRQIVLERKLFNSRIHYLPYEVITSLGIGILAGVVASVFIITLGIVIHPEEMWLVWGISLFLILFNIRFLCLSYATGLLGVVAAILQFLNITSTNLILDLIISIHIPSLIAIVALLHLIEAILIRVQASKQATPMFIETKRGKLAGAFHIQSYWLLPLFLVVATGETDGINISWSWWPLIGGGMGISIIPIPAIIGYNDITSVYSPYKKSRNASNYLLIYSLVLLAMAFAVEVFVDYQVFAALFAGLAHEAIHFIGKSKEKKLPLKYVHPSEGLMVFSVLTGSIASRMGIKAGEVILKINGIQVNSKEELYYALQQQSTFVKLELINLNGEIKLTNHSICYGEHHQLGIILAPDEDAQYYIRVNNINLLQLTMQKVKKIYRGA